MSTYTVNASILLTEVAILRRPSAVADAGFTAAEFWWPFPGAVPSDSDVDAFVGAVQDAGLQLSGLNFFAGDMAAGDDQPLLETGVQRQHPVRSSEDRVELELDELGVGGRDA